MNGDSSFLLQLHDMLFNSDGRYTDTSAADGVEMTESEYADAVAFVKTLFPPSDKDEDKGDVRNMKDYSERLQNLFNALAIYGKDNPGIHEIVEHYLGVKGDWDESERQLAFSLAAMSLANDYENRKADEFANLLAASRTKGGEGEILSPLAYNKKQYAKAEQQAQAEEQKNVCGFCNKNNADLPTPLLKCSRCLSVWYCGKTCQVHDWKEHKKVCKTLLNKRIEAAASDVDKAGEGMPLIPWAGIALPQSLTGLDGEVVCHVTPWDFYNEDFAQFVRRRPAETYKNIAKTVKYFFKKYNTSPEAASQISVRDVGDLCYDAISLFHLGYPGVRQISSSEGMAGQGKFLVAFMGFSAIPDGWTLDSCDTSHLPPEMVAKMEREIEKMRNDPRFQKRDYRGLP